MKPQDREQPIQSDFYRLMNSLAPALDDMFNGGAKGTDRKIGFALLVFPFGETEGGRVNYISNAERAEMLVAMKEFIARAEGRYFEPENKQ